MPRNRDIPNVHYRSDNFVNLTIRRRPDITIYEMYGAANVDDAYGATAGVSTNNPILMFRMGAGETYISPSVRTRRTFMLDEVTRNLSRAVYDPDDFATTPTAVAPGRLAYLPSDSHTSFVKLRSFNSRTASWEVGPIVAVPPSDFNSTTSPNFTFTGVAPNLGLAAYPVMPDTLDPSLDASMNIILPGYSQTVNIFNLDATEFLYVSFQPGTPVMLIKPGENLSLTGSGTPEFLVAADNGNPRFTALFSLANQ